VNTRSTKISLAVCSLLVIAFLWIPLVIIGLYAFNKSNIQGWPISSWTLHWFSVTWHNAEARAAFWLSVKVALVTTGIALALGTMAAAAVARFRFFGRDTISFLLVLPLALPGIITGTALLRFFDFANIQVSIWTIVIGHATFCVVVVYNNVVAFFVIAVTAIPVIIAQRVMRDTGVIGRGAAQVTEAVEAAEIPAV